MQTKTNYLTFKLYGSIRTLMAGTGNMSFAGKA